MFMISQDMRRRWGNNKETVSTIWGTDWYLLWYSQSLHHKEQTLDPMKYTEIML